MDKSNAYCPILYRIILKTAAARLSEGICPSWRPTNSVTAVHKHDEISATYFQRNFGLEKNYSDII